ncbi:MAG: radical SAM protein [Anaerolineae bacterium]
MATWRQKAALLSGLLRGDIGACGPLYVDLDLSERCNLRCLGCAYHSPYLDVSRVHAGDSRDISLDLVQRLSRELAALGTRTVVLQGAGEPLLHPQAAQAVAILKAAGMHVTLLTNGTLLDRAMVAALVASGLDVLKVSLWAATPETYASNYPGTSPAYLDRVLEGLDLLRAHKAQRAGAPLRVWIHHPINRANCRELDTVAGLALAKGCDGLSFSPFSTFGVLSAYALSAEEESAVRENLATLHPRLAAARLADNIPQVLERYRLGQAMGSELPCYVGWFHARVRVDGTVQPCGRCSLTLGSMEALTFAEVWRGADYQAFRRQAMTCQGLQELSDRCTCTYCCYLADNLKVHHLYHAMAFAAPLYRRMRGAHA